MNKQKSILTAMTGLVVSCCLLFTLTLAAGQQGRIVIKVLDGKGQPLEGVKITITTPSLTTYKVEGATNKEGRYETIVADATMKYKFRFDKEGYLPVETDKKIPINSTEKLDIEMLNQDQAIEKGLVKSVVDPFTSAFNEAVDKYKAGDLEGAAAKAEEAIKLGPDKPVGFDLAAKVAHQRKDFDKTIEYGEKALALEPDNPSLYALLVDAYRTKGNNAKAKEYEKKFAEANPENPEILYNQAVEFLNKGDNKSAEPFLRKAVAAKPDFADAHFQLGMACMTLNKIPDMKKHLNEYLKLSPKGKDAAAAKEMLDAFK